jgi:cobalt/nickel transport system permease protein
MMLGWSAVPALFIALLLQGLLFQFGGLLSLGVNTTVMGTAALTGAAVFRLGGKWRLPAAFAGGFTAVISGTVLVTAALVLSDSGLKATAALLFAANLPLAVVEGIISVFITAFLSKLLPGYVPGQTRI